MNRNMCSRSAWMSKASLHSTVSSLSSGASYRSANAQTNAMFLSGQVQAMSTIPEEKSFLDVSTHKASAGYRARPSSASVRSSISKNSSNNDNNNINHYGNYIPPLVIGSMLCTQLSCAVIIIYRLVCRE